jgi:integrase
MPRRKQDKPKRRRRNTGSIIVLADGAILARIPAHLDKRRPSREFPPGQRDRAEAWLDAILHPRPVVASTAIVTVREWTGTWWQTYVEPVRPPTTARRYRHSLRLLAPLYRTALAELRPSMLQQLVGELSGRLDATTVQDAVGVWRRCLEAAVDDDLIAKNPARRLTVPTASPAEQRHVTPAEVAALWPAIRGHRFEAAYALALGVGLRIGEILGLHWSNVDLAARTARIEHQWTDHRMRPAPKGRTVRTVRLPPPVVAALIRHRDAQPPGAILVMQSPHPAQRRKGRTASREPRPWSYETVRADLIAVCEAAGLAAFAPHAARRGLSSALLDGRVSPAAVAERLGHRSAATTLRHYSQLSAEARAQADALVDDYLGGAPTDVSGTEPER